MGLEPCLPTTLSGTNEIPLQGHGVVIHALSNRALWWPKRKILFVADLHFGKGTRVDPSPHGAASSAKEMLSRLAELLKKFAPDLLIVLGDWVDAKQARNEFVSQSISAWRKAHLQISIQLILGNHDRPDDDRFDLWGIEPVHGPMFIEPFELVHNPRDHRGPEKPIPGFRLSGHLHPSVRTASGTCLPCFWSLPNLLVLPAFHPGLKWYPVSSSGSGHFYPIENHTFVEFR